MAELDDETLVAYLDGELDAATTQTLELQLAQQPQLKERLEKLRRAWELLDEIPDMPPSPNFAASTMEMIALSEVQEQAKQASWISRNFLGLLLASIPLAFVVGFVGTLSWQRQRDRQLLADLPLLVEWRAIKSIDSTQWIDVLTQEPNLISAMSAESESKITIGDGHVPMEMGKRREWIVQLNEADRNRLRDAKGEFEKIKNPDSYRQLIEHIYSDEAQLDKRLAAVRAYTALLQSLTLSQRERLRELAIADRTSELRKRITWQMAINYRKNIPKEDVATIRSWAEELVATYQIPSPWDDAVRSIHFELFNNSYSNISKEDIDGLARQLSSTAQSILASFGETDREYALIDWLRSVAYPPEPPVERLDMDRLRKLYSELDNDLIDLDRIDLLPPEQAQNELRKTSLQRVMPNGK